MEQPVASSLIAAPELSPLEQDVLDEYARLAENMKKVGPLPRTNWTGVFADFTSRSWLPFSTRSPARQPRRFSTAYES
jgi:hypothetical protein